MAYPTLGRLGGKQFGHLKCIRQQGSIDGFVAYLCICACGTALVARGGKLLDGTITACNGKFCEAAIDTVAAPEKNSWSGMVQRCHNKENSNYFLYGKKGVRVCDRWRKDFSQFLSDMGPRPSLAYSIDRYPDTFGNYELGNCRWATRKQQAQNKRTTVRVEYQGERVPLCALADRAGLPTWIVLGRVQRGWPVAKALATPVKHHPRLARRPVLIPMTTAELARLVGATHWNELS